MRALDQDLAENWFSLMEALKQGQVIPVVGPELLEIHTPDSPDSSPPVRVDSLVVRKLADRYGSSGPGMSATSATPWSSYEYVGQMIGSGRVTPEKARRSVAAAVMDLSSAAEPPQVLRNLASIEAIRIYVSLTCDDLLFRALREEDPRAAKYAFSIRGDTGTRKVDIPANPPGKVSYQLFGSAENFLDFAVHEGDVLEYLFRLQSEQARSVRNILARIRSSHLLLIGCRLPDWLGRSLLRLANSDTLHSKGTMEFMAETEGDATLTTFVSRFSPNSLRFPGTAADFVAELTRRWRQLPESTRRQAVPAFAPALADMARNRVFVSYASEDRPAAAAIAARLSELGAAEVWFDRKSLQGGGEWGNDIERAIDECDYFMPLLSVAADQRREGEFWAEWDRALKRSKRRPPPFLLPTLIDPETDTETPKYSKIGKELGTDAFFRIELFRAPAGRLGPKSEDDLRALFDPPQASPP